ncbi:uncharacterized protein LOC143887016 isoform X2 [Tasmannia lanceolata]|uniref:uncharacterized protein LOC143887016 isoform X2 n=1 Tax=Tasmannia lanceolata TaxID=3420 RepID=UPI004062FC54
MKTRANESRSRKSNRKPTMGLKNEEMKMKGGKGKMKLRGEKGEMKLKGEKAKMKNRGEKKIVEVKGQKMKTKVKGQKMKTDVKSEKMKSNVKGEKSEVKAKHDPYVSARCSPSCFIKEMRSTQFWQSHYDAIGKTPFKDFIRLEQNTLEEAVMHKPLIRALHRI